MSGNDEGQIRDIVNSIAERLIIATDGIDPLVQREYLEYSKAINHSDYAKDISEMIRGLFTTSSYLEKKKTLAVLAQQGTLEAYRTIEKFLETGDQLLKDWSILAQQECRILLESSLSDLNAGIVMTGLGGENNRLRYYLAVHSRNNASLSDIQKETIVQGFSHICRQYDSILEETLSYQNYGMMKVLVPMNVAVADIIEGGINECNTFGDFLSEDYYVTNVRIPSTEDIQHYFSELGSDRE